MLFPFDNNPKPSSSILRMIAHNIMCRLIGATRFDEYADCHSRWIIVKRCGTCGYEPIINNKPKKWKGKGTCNQITSFDELFFCHEVATWRGDYNGFACDEHKSFLNNAEPHTTP